MKLNYIKRLVLCAALALALTATGFTARQAQSNPLTGLSKICLNEKNVVYRYFAIRPAG